MEGISVINPAQNCNIWHIKLLQDKPDHALIQRLDGYQTELAIHLLKGALFFGKHLEVKFYKHAQMHPSSDSTDYSSSKLNHFNHNLAKK